VKLDPPIVDVIEAAKTPYEKLKSNIKAA